MDRLTSHSEPGRGWTWWAHRLVASGLIALLQFSATPAAAKEPLFPEYELKASFLLRLHAFVRWPSRVPPRVKVCIAGADPFGEALDFLAKERNIRVARLEPGRDASGCSVVYLGQMDPASSASFLRSLAGRPVLTVSDAGEFARAGGMVRFVTENDRIRFEINKTAVDSAHLALDSQLLTLANIVHHALPWASAK